MAYESSEELGGSMTQMIKRTMPKSTIRSLLTTFADALDNITYTPEYVKAFSKEDTAEFTRLLRADIASTTYTEVELAESFESVEDDIRSNMLHLLTPSDSDIISDILDKLHIELDKILNP